MLSTIASKAQQIFELTSMASLGVAVVKYFLNLNLRLIIMNLNGRRWLGSTIIPVRLQVANMKNVMYSYAGMQF